MLSFAKTIKDIIIAFSLMRVKKHGLEDRLIPGEQEPIISS